MADDDEPKDTSNGDDSNGNGKDEESVPSTEDLVGMVFGGSKDHNADLVKDAQNDPEKIDKLLEAMASLDENLGGCIICSDEVTCQQCGGSGFFSDEIGLQCLHCRGEGTCPHNR